MRISILLTIVICGVFCVVSCDQSAPPNARSKDDRGAESSTDTATDLDQGAVTAEPAANAAGLPPAETSLDPTAAKRIGVGDHAPRFQLRDQNGQERTLASLLEKGHVALVFFRSAHW